MTIASVTKDCMTNRRKGGGGVGLLAQWVKFPAWKVGDCGFKPHAGL